MSHSTEVQYSTCCHCCIGLNCLRSFLHRLDWEEEMGRHAQAKFVFDVILSDSSTNQSLGPEGLQKGPKLLDSKGSLNCQLTSPSSSSNEHLAQQRFDYERTSATWLSKEATLRRGPRAQSPVQAPVMLLAMLLQD